MAARLPQSRIAILGCGPVGRAFACEFARLEAGRAHEALVLWSRSSGSVAKLLARLPERTRKQAQVVAEPADVLGRSDVLLLCMAETALAPIAQALADRATLRMGRGTVVLVTSGFAALRPLAFLRGRRIALGRLHPLAPVLDRTPGSLRGAPFAIEGDLRARRTAALLAERLDGFTLRLSSRPGAATAYHAGAALLGGGLVALFHLAETVMATSLRAGVGLRRRALLDFLERVARNAATLGPASALTGPLARGAEATVRAHLRALGRMPEASAVYRRLGETMLDLAGGRGTPAERRRLRALLRLDLERE